MVTSTTQRDKHPSENAGTGVVDSAKDMAKGAAQKVSDGAKKVGEEAKSFASDAAQKVSDGAKKVGEEAKSLASDAAQKAADLGNQAKGVAAGAIHKAEDAACFIGHKAEEAKEAVGTGMKSLGTTIREHTPKEGVVADAGAAVAGTLESGANYLEHHGFKDIGDEMTNIIRRNPIPAVLVGIGVGFLLARAIRS